MKRLRLALIVLAICVASLHATPITGCLNTSIGGLVSGGDWVSANGGYCVTWTITENASDWHYEYTFYDESRGSLGMDTSHFIIELSKNIELSDLYNFTGDVDPEDGLELGIFGSAGGNPGFPTGKSIYGIKINLGLDQTTVGFDSNRSPMWADFYAKDGKFEDEWNYAYNSDLGIEVANPNDYSGEPVDEEGNALVKILAPDTIPEPMTVCLLGLGGLLLRKKNKI